MDRNIENQVTSFPSHRNRYFFNRILLLAFAAILLAVFLAHLTDGLWDDAYFFKRIAHNFVTIGTLTWNPGELPVYGITAQLFLLPAVAVYLLSATHYIILIKLFLAVCLWGAFFLSLKILNRAAKGESSVEHSGALLLFGFSLPPVLVTVNSGMETAAALFLITLSLLILFTGSNRAGQPLRLGLIAVLIYLIRPDAILLVLGVALIWFWRNNFARFLKISLIAGSGVVAFLFLFSKYYGTALPLSFYLKSAPLTGYYTHFLSIARRVKLFHFTQFIYYSAPFLLISLFRRDRRVLALVGGSLVFVLYHLLSTVEVMGMMARFYLPALMPIVLAASLTLPEFCRKAKTQILTALLLLYSIAGYVLLARSVLKEISPWLLLVYLISLGLIVAGARFKRKIFSYFSIILLVCGILVFRLPFKVIVHTDEKIVLSQVDRFTVWRGIKTLRRSFREPIHIYHSEIGVPGVLFLNSRVTDLSGLMNRRMTLGHLPFDSLCSEDQPEAIFLPHKNYRELNRQILRSACLAKYTRVVSKSSSPLYIRNDLLPVYREKQKVLFRDYKYP